MIYITGDTHGMIDFGYIKEYFAAHYSTPKDILFILGDVAPVWSKDDSSISDYDLLGPTIIYIDGNHENFELLNSFPLVNKFGAKMHMLSGNLYHVLRGEIAEINGLSFLCLGGATSIDKDRRIDRVSWWNEENITYSDIDNALNNLKKRDNKVDYVLTHCAPSSVLTKKIGYKKDKNTDALEELSSIVITDHWYFGHYHSDKIIDKKYRLFYHDILVIDKRYVGNRETFEHEYYLPDDGGGFLRHNGRKTMLKEDDLPEWYMDNRERDGVSYFSLRGVKHVAFSPSPFNNHINKDARLFLSYDKPIDLQKDRGYGRYYEAEVVPWRASLTRVIKGLAKYSPRLKLKKVEALINLNYDRYINEPDNWRGSPYFFRPFPEVETPILENTKFAVQLKGNVVCAFRNSNEVDTYLSNVKKSLGGVLDMIPLPIAIAASEGVLEAYATPEGVLWVISHSPNGENPQDNTEYDIKEASWHWNNRM